MVDHPWRAALQRGNTNRNKESTKRNMIPYMIYVGVRHRLNPQALKRACFFSGAVPIKACQRANGHQKSGNPTHVPWRKKKGEKKGEKHASLQALLFLGPTPFGKNPLRGTWLHSPSSKPHKAERMARPIAGWCGNGFDAREPLPSLRQRWRFDFLEMCGCCQK